MLSELPPTVAVVIVMPPVYSDDLPAPHSSSGIRIAQCKSALDKIVAQRPRSGFLDFRVDNAMTREPENFMNAMHYRAVLARQMEQSVSAIIAAGASGAQIIDGVDEWKISMQPNLTSGGGAPTIWPKP
jgi:hypothetical protein